MRNETEKKQTTANLKLTENDFGLIHSCRGCVYLVKWSMQGLNVYTRGVFGRSMNPWIILNKWHIYVYQSAIQPMKAAKISILCFKWLWVWMSIIYSTNYYSAVFISCTAALQTCNSWDRRCWGFIK